MVILIENIDNDFIKLFDNNNIYNDFKNNPFIRYLFFVEDQTVLGYLSFEHIYDRFEIDNLFIKKEYRNKKIASLLLEYLIEYAKVNQAKNITLEVKKNNEIAIHLYKKYGFKDTAIRSGYYNGIDGILMEKEMI